MTYSGFGPNVLFMRVGIGHGGWIAADGIDLPGPLYVRLRETGGRWRIHELYLDASDSAAPIDGRDLRELPLVRIEAFVNLPDVAPVLAALAGVPSPDLSTLASYFSTSFGNYERQIRDGDWVVASFASQRIPEGTDRAVLEGKGLHTDEDAAEAEARGGVRVQRVKHSSKKWDVRETDREFRLTSGPTGGLTVEFLSDVARAYAAAVARGEQPNKAIAKQTGYELKTAQRWVYTARLRGLMPPGERGKAG